MHAKKTINPKGSGSYLLRLRPIINLESKFDFLMCRSNSHTAASAAPILYAYRIHLLWRSGVAWEKNFFGGSGSTFSIENVQIWGSCSPPKPLYTLRHCSRLPQWSISTVVAAAGRSHNQTHVADTIFSNFSWDLARIFIHKFIHKFM